MKLQCQGCRATVDAGCDCGLPYIPAGVAAAQAIEAHPEKNNQAIADMTGVSEPTARRIRKSVSSKNETAKRTGKDGKSYPATKRRAKRHSPSSPPTPPTPPTPALASPDPDMKLKLRTIEVVHDLLAEAPNWPACEFNDRIRDAVGWLLELITNDEATPLVNPASTALN